ncbi:hypothetical protein BGX38DRAFT_1259196 [Terfezia claveryi]|nr:hypothetical protein BGX38DRAFT_1259196 [Terfezia claveryi]
MNISKIKFFRQLLSGTQKTMANGWHCRTHFYTSTSSPLHRKVYTLVPAKKPLPHIPSRLIPASFCTPWPTGRSLLSSSSGKKHERSPGKPPANVPLMKPPPTSEPCPSQPLPENPEQWSPAHVLKYLEEKQVEYYLTDIHIAKFREQEIAGRDLLTLTKKDLGQPPLDFSHGPAIRIERLINVLRNLQALCNKHAVTIVVSTHPSTSRERRWGI